MDKTHNISLGGFAFIIEDSAFLDLQRYLQEIKLYLNNDASQEEIINDIEYRMAEIFDERIKNKRQVINIDDVNYIKSILGTPSQFSIDEESEGNQKKKNQNVFAIPAKKLYRDPANKKLGGVASGVAHYLNIDPSWVRIALICLPFLDFIFLGISTFSLVLAYIILWIVIPEATTTAEKLEMYGDSVNVDSIRSFNRDESENKKKTSLGDSLIFVFKLIFKIILGIIGVGLLLAIAVSLIALFFGGGIVAFGTGLAAFSLPEILSIILENDWELWVLYPSLILMILTPLILIILLIIRIVSSRFKVQKNVVSSLIGLFLIGLIGFIAVTATTLKAFQRSTTVIEHININEPFDILKIENVSNAYDNDLFQQAFSTVYLETSSDSLIHIQIHKKANGKNLTQAKENANFNNLVKVYNNTISFNEIIPIDTWDKWRKQEEKIFIQIPEGQKIQFNQVSQSYPTIGVIKGVITPNQEYYNLKNEETYIYSKGKLWTLKEFENKKNLENDFLSTDSSLYNSTVELDDEDDSDVRINSKGIHIKDGENSNVEINRKGIHIKDDEQEVNIHFD